MFLVKWADYDKSNCTWEPTNHIPPAIRDTYTNPLVSSDRLQSAATALEFAVQRRLRLRNNYLSITFDADVYRHCFGLSTNKLVYENDIEKTADSEWLVRVVNLQHKIYDFISIFFLNC